jgi:hypothetical protein
MKKCISRVCVSKILSTYLLSFVSFAVLAQDDLAEAWEGEWIAEGTLFQIKVDVQDNVLSVTQIESMGFEWSSQDAVINGNVVEVAVDYVTGGVSGIVRAELLNETTGVLSVTSCAPDFMVSCALSKGRQAVFKKVAAP